MEIRQLESFRIAAEMGSTRRAAETLYTSQSSVSKNIAMLEDELGVQLFVRSNRGLGLTARGRELYEHARNILDAIALMKTVSSREQQRRLSISSYPSKMISHLLCLLYNELRDEDYHMTFLEGTISEVVDNVDKNVTDLGIVYFACDQARQFRHILGHKEMVFVELSRHEPCLYVGPNNPFYHRESVEFHELGQCKFAQPLKDFFSIEHHLDTISLGMARPSQFRERLITNSDNQLIEMLLYTDICSFGLRLLHEAYRIHDIRDIPIAGCGKCLSLGYIKRSNFVLGKEYERFLELMQTKFQLDGSQERTN